jgi:uncharacterized protein YebE (UPF0316 family)
MIYILILFAKMVEVSLMTVRIVLITKGERKIGSIIGFFEIMIWIYVASSVINDLANDPLKAVVYGLGFALGNYFGSRLEEKIGIGLSQVQIIVKSEDGYPLAEVLRKEGYAVTLVHGEGKNFERNLLFSYVKRKRIHHLLEVAKANQENAVITVMDTKPLYGGYGLKK